MEETSEQLNRPNDVFRFVAAPGTELAAMAAEGELLYRFLPLLRGAEGNPVWTRSSEKMLKVIK